MLVLFETSAGYAIFKVRLFFSLMYHFFVFFQLLDEKKLQETKNLYVDFESPEKAANVYAFLPTLFFNR